MGDLLRGMQTFPFFKLLPNDNTKRALCQADRNKKAPLLAVL
jgi:hypothetical protein